MVRRRAKLAGRYRLEELLGRGGMGEVWRAVDLRLRRSVAVKILPLTVAAGPTEVARFRREAEVAARLDHPGITTVFDVGEHRDGDEHWLFLVMELLAGRDLRHLIAANPGGLPIERVRELAVQITDALAAANRHEVVHRDVKPANLILAEDGRVKICDFGIARLADATRITATGSTSGTPLYMAPEQIQGGTVDHRTDLYAFGCVLYELLTGKTWIQSDSNVGAILYQHINQPPAPPTSVRADIPDPLDTLVVDLLAKRPGDRPQDAVAVAERLRQLPGQPGRPSSVPPDAPWPERPEPTAPITSVPVPRRIRRRTVVLGGIGAAVVAGVPAAWLLTSGDSRPYVSLEGHTGEVMSVAFSPDGKTLATASWDHTARLWDVATGRTVAILAKGDGISLAAFSPDGKTLATNNGGSVRFWDVASRRATGTLTAVGDVTELAYSPDRKTLATGSIRDVEAPAAGDLAARLWDVASRRTTATFADGDGVFAVRFSPDGKILAIGDGSSHVQLREVDGGRTTATLVCPGSGQVESIAFSPDGRTIAAGGEDKPARMWNVATGRIAVTLPGHSDGDTGHDAVAFSPDGKTLATGSRDYTAQLWNVATGREIVTLTGHDSVVTSVAFSPDGRTLATGSMDKTARLWKIK